MQDYEQKFRDLLTRKGLKLTTPRRLILEAVFSLHEHFDVEQLNDHLRNKNGDVSRATIYRTLPLLLEAGLIQYSLRSSSREVYEHIFGHPRHIHWVCASCGAVLETSLEQLMPLLQQSSQILKFQIEEIQIKLSGLCWKCQTSETENQ